MFDKIQNPITGKWVKINSNVGKRVINNFKMQIAGGDPNYKDEAGWHTFREMNNNKNAYELLGIERNATPQEIKKAYRKLSLKYHPDRLVGKPQKEKDEGQEIFKNAAISYKILYDDPEGQYKERYDRWLASNPVGAPQQGAPAGPPRGPGSPGQPAGPPRGPGSPGQPAGAQPESPPQPDIHISSDEAKRISQKWYIHMNWGIKGLKRGSSDLLENGIVKRNYLLLAMKEYMLPENNSCGALFIHELYHNINGLTKKESAINGLTEATQLKPTDIIEYSIIKKNPSNNKLLRRPSNPFALEPVTSIILEPKKQEDVVAHDPINNPQLFGSINARNFGGGVFDLEGIKYKLQTW
jgi:hypothetical protein